MMEIINRVGCNFTDIDVVELGRYGISVSKGFDAFEIEDADPTWDRIKPWVSTRQPVVISRTRFTRWECNSAKFLDVVPTWHHGYPMPDDGGYKDLTYDRFKGCHKCGVGWTQKAPFRMKGEPKWGKKQILQLNWIFDEFFVLPETYEAVFKPFGIQGREVLHHKTGERLKTVIQLVVDKFSTGKLQMDKQPDEVCEQCGHPKFHPHTRGFFPKLLAASREAIFKSQEYFGSGGSAWQAIIISQELYQAMHDAKLKGVGYYPLAH